MNVLSQGCWYSDFNVSPANWNTARASIKKSWYIEYWFHDPAYRELHPNGYQKRFKSGINRFKTLAERQDAVRILLEQEKDMLELHGYNPISAKLDEKTRIEVIPSEAAVKLISEPESIDYVLPSTPLRTALTFARKQKKFEDQTYKYVENLVSNFNAAASKLTHPEQKLPMDIAPVSEVRGRHVMMILKQLSIDHGIRKRIKLAEKIKLKHKITDVDRKNLDGFTPYTHNSIRKFLWGLFKILIKQEAIIGNPMDVIDRQTETTAPREVLSNEDRKRIDIHLKETNYTFWRFLHIFFNSGSREEEMLRVQIEHVDFKNQKFKILHKKGKSRHWTWKPINHLVTHLWKEILEEATTLPPDESGDPLFIFSEGLRPAYRPKQIRGEQIGRRWKRHVKDKLGIQENFYWLKRLKTTETIDQLTRKGNSIEEAEKLAAEQNGHTSTEMVSTVYDVKSEKRKLDRLTRVTTPFA